MYRDGKEGQLEAIRRGREQDPPVPLPSSHIDPPWKMDVTKAKSKGEIAKIRPTRIKGKRRIL
jgi:hypothetical protein